MLSPQHHHNIFLRFRPALAAAAAAPTVPPTQLVILDHLGATQVDGAIGPYREGTSVNISCLSSGGVPPPRVSWWREHALLDDSFQVQPDGSVRNVLHVPKMSRRDLLTVRHGC